jgi:nucleoside-diphosphate-sugar epimerase
MKVLVTGGAGLCGRDIAPLFAKHYNYEIITTDIRKPDNDFPYLPCDIRNINEVDQIIKASGVDAIIHLGTLQPGLGPADMSIDINVKGVCNILESAKNNGVKRVVFTSSVWAGSRGPNAEYQPIDEEIKPTYEDMYDITKHMGEELCAYYHKMFGLNAIAFRFCGYDPIEGFDDNGDILWEKIDILKLVGRYCGIGPSYKLTNAWDLTQAFKMAIENDKYTHGLYLIGVGMPFVSEEAEALRNNPITIYEKYYPGISDFFKKIGFNVPNISFWYNTKKAKEQLGFSPKFTLQDIMCQYYENQ